MKISVVLIILVPVLYIGIACTDSRKEASQIRQPPNIVLIISDDQNWTDYGFMGHEHIETPRLDQLASEGVTFTYGYSTAPLCSPSLASIITGLYPSQHGILGNDPVFTSAHKNYSSDWLVERMEEYQKYLSDFTQLSTIADLLKSEGYTSLQVGKWWLGNYRNGGFDQGMTHGDPTRGGRHGDEGLAIGRKGMNEVYSFMDSAQAQNSPFFVWYAPFLPHAPHNPPDSLREKYLKVAPTKAVANYWAMCEWFDVTCGQLMDYVDRLGLSENTLFVYVTDNGWIQDPERPNKYAPRSKRAPYEGGIRTPIMFRWLGTIEPEMNTLVAVSSIDIATTILSACGISAPEQIPGINLLNTDELRSRDVIFAENYAHDFSTIDSSLLHRIAINLPYKLIVPNQANQQVELFNLKDDPYENENLAATRPEIVNELREKIESWWKH
ncbi:MAG: sulfatase-like hydrolase/transferase [Bacteroidota bacterium]